MSTLTSGGPRLSTVVASAIATTAGGAMDAWVYLAHGYVLANAQTGSCSPRGTSRPLAH